MGHAGMKEIFFKKDLLPWLRLPRSRKKWQQPFLHQLASCVDAEIDLGESLDVCAREGCPRHVRPIMRKLKQAIEEGGYLSDALRKHAPAAFPKSFYGILEIGEKSGQLADALKTLEKGYEQVLALKRRMVTVMIYPCFLALASLTALGTIFFRVLPTFAEIFSDLNAPLPRPTQALLAISTALRTNLPAAVGIPLLLVLALYLLVRMACRTKLFGRYFFRIPFFGRVLYHLNIFYFCKLMSMLLKSGIQLDEALSFCENDALSPAFSIAVKSLKHDISEGASFSSALEAQQIFSPTLVWFASVGEQRGDLVDSLQSAGEYEVALLEDRIQLIPRLYQPIGTILMSIIIGFIIISMALPFIALSTLISY